MRRWTHQFGYGGQYLTKSRRYPPPSARCARPAGTGNSPAVASNAPATPNDGSPTSHTHTPPVEHVQVDDHTDSAADPARFVLVVEWGSMGSAGSCPATPSWPAPPGISRSRRGSRPESNATANANYEH